MICRFYLGIFQPSAILNGKIIYFIQNKNGYSLHFLSCDISESCTFYIILYDVKGATFRYITAQKMQGIPVFVLDKVNDFTIQNSKGLKDAQIKTTNHRTL